MPRPIIHAVDEDADSLRAIERELGDRYGRSYRVVCVGAAPEAEAELAQMADAGEDVALALAGECSAAPREASCSAKCGSSTRRRSAAC